MLDVRGRDPAAVVDRAHELREGRSRRPHHRLGELGIPGYAREPLDDEDVVAGNERVARGGGSSIDSTIAR